MTKSKAELKEEFFSLAEQIGTLPTGILAVPEDYFERYAVKIYLAGPDVFKPNAKEIGKQLVATVRSYGFEGLYPLDNEISGEESKFHLGKMIAEANMKMIHDCHIVLANLEPFRGPSADCGTVWECAFAKGLGKTVYGYNFDPTKYKDKVIGKLPHDGMHVEDFDTWDNIMLTHGIDEAFANIQTVLSILHKKA